MGSCTETRIYWLNHLLFPHLPSFLPPTSCLYHHPNSPTTLHGKPEVQNRPSHGIEGQEEAHECPWLPCGPRGPIHLGQDLSWAFSPASPSEGGWPSPVSSVVLFFLGQLYGVGSFLLLRGSWGAHCAPRFGCEERCGSTCPESLHDAWHQTLFYPSLAVGLWAGHLTSLNLSVFMFAYSYLFNQ